MMQNESDSTSHFDPALIRAYAEGRATSGGSSRALTEAESAISGHLVRCDACASIYVAALFKSKVGPATVPSRIWPNIQARLRGHEVARKNGTSRGASFTLGFTAVLVLIIAALAIFQSRIWSARAETLDLGEYLSSVEADVSSPNVPNLVSHLGGFTHCDSSAALSATGLSRQVENYRLVEQQVSESRPAGAFQLLYDSGTDAFALFVAPKELSLNFGSFNLVPTEVSGLSCRRAECPRQDVFVFTGAAHHYIFIRRHRVAPEASQIFGELVNQAATGPAHPPGSLWAISGGR